MAKPKHSKPPKPDKLRSGWSQFRASLRDYMRHWKLYTLILVVVSLPIDLLSLSPTFAADAQFGAATQFASLFMNLALLWAIIHLMRGDKVTLGQSYYQGTSSLLRYILVGVTEAAVLIFAALGAFLYNLSLQSIFAQPAWSPEQLIVAAGCFIIALPSLYLIVRFGLGIVAVVHDDLRPMAALRRSWRLTRRRYWPVAGRLVQLLLYLALVAIPPSLIAAGLSLVHLTAAASFVFELFSALLALPIANYYAVALYRDLVATMPGEAA